MAKMMKRLIAAAITASMLTSFIAVPVFAAEEEETTNPSVTVEIKNEGGEVIGTMTTNTTTSSDGSTTTTNKEWNTTETTQKPGESKPAGENTTQKTDSNTTVEKDGQEEIKDTVVTDDKGTTESGSSVGNETTTTTITTTVTTTTKDEVLEESDPDISSGEPDETIGNPGEMLEGDGEGNLNSEWVESPENDVEGEWIPEETEPAPSETVEQELVEDALVEDKTEGGVKLEMNKNNGYKDSEKITISVEDVMPKQEDLPEGAIVEKIMEGDKVVGYKVITYTDEVTGEPGEIVEDSESGEGKKSGKTETKTDIVYLEKGKYGTDDYENKDDKGNLISSKVTTELEDGTGYKITETVVKNDSIEGSESTESFEGKDQFFNGEPVLPEGAEWADENHTSYVQLPKRPEASESVDADGNKVEVSWEAVIDETTKAVIGYKTTTTVTDEDGKLVSRESSTEYGTITSFGTTITTDPETKQTTTVTETYVQGLKQIQTYIEKVKGYQETTSTRVAEEDAYALVETEDGGLVFMYNGQMYEVKDLSDGTKTAYKDVATDKTVSSSRYDTDEDDLRMFGDSFTDGKNDYYTDQIIGKGTAADDASDNYWELVGYGLFSDFAAKEKDGSSHQTKMFKIEKATMVNGERVSEYQYVYCVELGVTTSRGNNYGQTEYENTVDENGEKITWNSGTKAAGTIGELRSVCLNGFWGTETGLGSLEAVQDLMRRNGLEEYADQMTAGMALTATQVAIWEFGANANGKFGGEDYDFVKLFTHYNGGTKVSDPTDKDYLAKQDAIMALRDLLVKLAKSKVDENGESAGKAEVIDDTDITGSSITLNNKVTEKKDNGENEVKKDSNGNDVYNADLGFTLDVSTSSINGDLKVTVYQGGEKIGYYRLAGDESEDLLDKVFYKGKIYPDANGTYTLAGLELAEGVMIDLQLTGTQHLDDGIYIFNSNSVQDFVGLSKLEKDVNLTFSMEFSVTDPEMNHSENQWNESKTDKKAYTRDNYYHTEAFGTKTTETMTVTTKVFGTVTQADTTTKTTHALREWETYYEEFTPVEDGGFFTLIRNDGQAPTVIIDEQVPLARAPKTGDASIALVMVILFAATGLVVVNRKRELI